MNLNELEELMSDLAHTPAPRVTQSKPPPSATASVNLSVAAPTPAKGVFYLFLSLSFFILGSAARLYHLKPETMDLIHFLTYISYDLLLGWSGDLSFFNFGSIQPKPSDSTRQRSPALLASERALCMTVLGLSSVYRV